ncbi:hypothetical protein TorRG33x02_297400 [Trema orientale]|uniref:Uncharacterized protein n=1 Tax=Trema orientale TaxID=63057 RepID=A0A2P5C4Z1_TREOI|nr:hypothetical protein TorRG33x02_297400 [Trema orientale]
MDYRCAGLYQNGLDHMDARLPNDIVESVYWFQVLDIETRLKLALAGQSSWISSHCSV